MRRARISDRGVNLLAIGIVVAIIAVIVGAALAFNYATRSTVTFEVTDKGLRTDCDRSGNGDGNCKSTYMVYTDHGTFKDTDNILFLKTRSSDLYGELEKGHSYRCEVNGFRVPWTSSYKNLLSCEKVR